MIFRITLGSRLYPIPVVEIIKILPERPRRENLAERSWIVIDFLPDRGQPRAVRLIHSAGPETFVARLEVKVISRFLHKSSVGRKARAHVDLVRTLVLAEAHITVNAERKLPGLEAVQTGIKLDEFRQYLFNHFFKTLFRLKVPVFVGLKPIPVVVTGK